jgi:hypothetical protein
MYDKDEVIAGLASLRKRWMPATAMLWLFAEGENQ